MNKNNLLATAIAAIAFTVTPALAEDAPNMEKCKIVDAQGKGLIKEHKSDCATKDASCAGNNKAGDPEAWIMVPAGKCAQINKGDFSGVPDEIKEKIEGAK